MFFEARSRSRFRELAPVRTPLFSVARRRLLATSPLKMATWNGSRGLSFELKTVSCLDATRNVSRFREIPSGGVHRFPNRRGHAASKYDCLPLQRRHLRHSMRRGPGSWHRRLFNATRHRVERRVFGPPQNAIFFKNEGGVLRERTPSRNGRRSKGLCFFSKWPFRTGPHFGRGPFSSGAGFPIALASTSAVDRWVPDGLSPGETRFWKSRLPVVQTPPSTTRRHRAACLGRDRQARPS
ncbi:hypothetical protein M885DRAFT_119368 [Pelagophyceae sp. CCMP2097]|nr:hypothetical protein M885DRAFT_119368 [Pelagophyceae sp. CCMP2097]